MAIMKWLKSSGAMEIINGVFVLTDQQGYGENLYFLIGEKDFILIDSGDGSISIPEEPALTILTHNHYDHTSGVKPEWKNVLIHPADLKQHEHSRVPGNAKSLEQKTIEFPPFSLEVIPTPGHTPGSICLFEKSKKIIFTGDTLFAEGIQGRTDFREGSQEAMDKSLAFLSTLDYRILCPGHNEIEVHG